MPGPNPCYMRWALFMRWINLLLITPKTLSMPATKIFVNFVTRKCTNTTEPLNSPVIKRLRDLGFTYVGRIKKENPEIFWAQPNFEPIGKYPQLVEPTN